MKNEKLVEQVLELYKSLITTEEYLNSTDNDVSIKSEVTKVEEILKLLYSLENII